MEQAKKKKKKGWVIVVIVVVLLAGIGGGIVACSKALSDSIAQMGAGLLETSEVSKRDITNDISVSGQVESENMVKITSTLTAKVKTLHVEVGQEVKEGDLLCEFDSSDLQSQYDTLLKSQQNAQGMSDSTHRTNERNLANAKNERSSSLAQAQRAIDDAKNARESAYQKERELVAQFNDLQVKKGQLLEQAQAAQDPDTAEMLYTQAQEADSALQSINSSIEALRDQFASLDSAVQTAEDAYAATDRSSAAMIDSYQDALDNEKFNNDQSSVQSEIDKLKDMIDQCTVRAPKAGIITSINVAEGSIPTTDAIMTIENADALKITVNIAEEDILKVHPGMKAIVKTTATGDKEISATVSRVVNIYKSGTPAASAYESGTAGGYSAEIVIDDSNTDLLIGMNAKVRIVLDEKKDVLAVPYESIIEDEDGTFHVLLAVDQGDGTTRAKEAKVEKGMEGSFYTEITSSEVKEGDKVVMSPGDYKDGDVLPIFDFNAAANAANSSADEGDADE